MAAFSLEGPWRAPRNTSAHEKGGIHDDTTAQDLGFSGGTVAGNIHMEQFVPFLIKHLGQDWLQQGTISLYFRSATTDGVPVRCVGQPPVAHGKGKRMHIGMVDEQGTLVMDGTASIGPDPDSALRTKVGAVRAPSDIRVLADVVVDRWCDPFPVRIETDRAEQQLRVITEPLPMFGSADSAEGKVPPMSTLTHSLRAVEDYIVLSRGDFVGLFGAIEIEYHQGQPITGKEYLTKGRALALSDSPQTEIFWMESMLLDPETKEPLVTMVKMDRVMKASSPLWKDAG